VNVEVVRARHLQLAGTRNLRDIGGYPTLDGRRTRWRTVFRSGCLDQLTPASQGEVLALGVRTIVDLREHDELTERPNVFATSRHVAYRWLPFWNEPLPEGRLPDLSGGYVRELDLRGERLVAICRALLEPAGLPALIHCAAGKDRTGVVVGLLLAVARVPPEVIIEDYAMSATCLGPAYVDEGRQWLASRGWSWEQYGHNWSSPPERMTRTLAHLQQRWGSADVYLQDHGLGRPELDALRAQLTEAAGGAAAPAP